MIDLQKQGGEQLGNKNNELSVNETWTYVPYMRVYLVSFVAMMFFIVINW